ncbi:MAG: condensation domain-containing protein [Steroidobacteraceae bacterium]
MTATLSRWSKLAGVVVDVRGHGREDLFENVDVTRTVGLFMTIYPLSLPCRPEWSSRELVSSVKGRRREVPHRGLGYGLLRHGNQAAELAEIPPAQVDFNYLGQVDLVLKRQTRLGLAEEAMGPEQSPWRVAPYSLAVTIAVLDGRLQVRWAQQSDPEIAQSLSERFVECLRELIRGA